VLERVEEVVRPAKRLGRFFGREQRFQVGSSLGLHLAGRRQARGPSMDLASAVNAGCQLGAKRLDAVSRRLDHFHRHREDFVE